MDSLIAVDVGHWFATEIKADVAIFDLMGSTSLESMGIIAATRSLCFVQTG